MERLLSTLPFLALAVMAATVIALFFPHASPFGGIYLPLSPTEIMQRSDSLVVSIEVDMAGMTSNASFQRDQGLLRQLASEKGMSETNEIIRGGIPGFRWNVTWRRLDDLGIIVEASPGDEEAEQEVLNLLRGEVSVSLDPSGHLLGFSRRIPDSLVLPTMGANSARAMANTILELGLGKATDKDLDWAHELQSVSESSRDQPGHRQYTYLWAGTSEVLGSRTEVEVIIAGNILQRYEVRYVVPSYDQVSSGKDVREVLDILFYVFLIIAMIVAAIRIIRDYELGFRLAVVAGALVALAYGYQLFGEMKGFGLQQFIGLFLGPLFAGGAMLLLWAVAESVTRETTREKLISVDLLTRGHVFHSYVGKSAVQGIALGLTAYAVLLILVFVLGALTTIQFELSAGQVKDAFPTHTPLLSVLADRTVPTMYLFVLFVLFTVSWLRTRLPIPALAMVVSAFFLGFNNIQRLQPEWPAIGIQIFVFLIVVFAFYRYDVLAGILALLTYMLTPAVMALALSGSTFFEAPALLHVVGVAMVLIAGTGLQLRHRELTTCDDITPAVARNIAERQRLQQELEIGRRIQMSFLPKYNPQVDGLDIAAKCVPAQEVGGDYFDFIQLESGKLGIAIGDVSGKGTQAAFYMTLAKGFLKALSPYHDSPAEVLSHLNKLFYENVERGAFISMVYATIDVSNRELVIARAGHNPVIMRKSEAVDVEVLQPNGLGLGLEGGTTFSKTIEEISIRFKLGDTFVFYTDGFSEARNKEKLEFGEEKLHDVVNSVSSKSAEQILDAVFVAVKKFAGKEKQHDDMTLVVLKIA
jgi:sigma-B regulation protein RsbU (phosphoserine phosphatase)